MRKIFFLLLFLIPIVTFSQFDDLLKKIPGLKDFAKKTALTSNIDDAYDAAFWMIRGIDENIEPKKVSSFDKIEDGYYRLKLKSFCLKTGGYAPADGSGYLIAKMKGVKASLIRDVIDRYSFNPQIDQRDVQRLIWAIEAGAQYSKLNNEFKIRIAPLLSPQDILSMEADPYEIAELVLPDEVKNVLKVYESVRNILYSASSDYDELERIAVRTGTPPSKDEKVKVEKGNWTLMNNGYYVRIFPQAYRTTYMEVYKPGPVSISWFNDNSGFELTGSVYTIKVTFDVTEGSNSFEHGGKNYSIRRFQKVEFYKNQSLLSSIENKGWFRFDRSNPKNTVPYQGLNKPESEYFGKYIENTDKFTDQFKKYLKKNKLKANEKILSEIELFKNLEQGISIAALNDLQNLAKDDIYGILRTAYDLTLNKITESAQKKLKGGSETSLFSFSGFLAVPGNTSMQRIGVSGNGTGEEGETGDPGETGETGETGEEEDPPRIILRQVNRDILPSPGVMYSATLEIESEKPVQEIVFDLYGISRENGRFLNDKDPEYFKTTPDADMIFDPSANYGYEITSSGNPDWFVATGSGSAPRMITMQAKDYGAFAKLKARVKIDGNWYDASCEGWSNFYINVPYDLNNNKIADKWEDDNLVSGFPAENDEDNIPFGQATDGDGMTIYEEYRGFQIFTAEMTSRHVRTDPLKKEMFVIDPENMLSIVGWKTASEIEVYKLNTEMVYGSLAGTDADRDFRLVNFCRGFARGNKYAINIEKVEGLIDPYGQHPDILVFGYCFLGPPINVSRAVMFPDRIEKWLLDQRDSLVNLLARFPATETNISYGTRPWPRTFLQLIVNMINDESQRFLLHDFCINRTVIHELGHGCNVEHHGGGTRGQEGTGDPDCVMRYANIRDRAETFTFLIQEIFDEIGDEEVLPVISYTNWKFCRTTDNCWNKINVNDSRP